MCVCVSVCVCVYVCTCVCAFEKLNVLVVAMCTKASCGSQL